MSKFKAGNGRTSDEPEKSEFDSWVPGTVEKDIDIKLLKEHPQNYEIVGKIDDNTRAELLEDIKQNGIREPLQVWYNGGKLYVVSGNERLSIARELRFKTVKCIKVDFKGEDEVLRFIYAVNKHRKRVSTNATELLLKLFPDDKYPLLYADLRGDLKHGITAGNTDSMQRQKNIEKQRELEKEAGEALGITPASLKKSKSQARERLGINKPKTKKTGIDHGDGDNHSFSDRRRDAKKNKDDQIPAEVKKAVQKALKSAEDRAAFLSALVDYLRTLEK